MSASLIAPCGMNCAICLGYLREKNRCGGCRGDDDNKPVYCVSCVIINCEKRQGKQYDFCFVCDLFPCARLKALDKRYRTKYAMSMLENLAQMRDEGMDAFLNAQRKKYTCQSCGGTVCVHRGFCLKCKK